MLNRSGNRPYPMYLCIGKGANLDSAVLCNVDGDWYGGSVGPGTDQYYTLGLIKSQKCHLYFIPDAKPVNS